MGIKTLNLTTIRNQFKPDEVIDGKVALELSEPVTIEALFVHVSGVEETKFMRSNGRPCNERFPCFSEKVFLLDNKVSLFGRKPSKLPAGNHIVPFSLKLPEVLPGSFIGECGKIEYFCEAVAKLPHSIKSHRSQKLPFNVHENNRMLLPALPLPLLREDTFCSVGSDCSFRSQLEKQTSCVGIGFGPVKIAVSLSTQLLRPLDTLKLSLDLENGSRATISETAVGIVEIRTYKTNKVALTCRSVVCGRINCRQIAPGGSFSWSGIALELPGTVNADVANSNIISVGHELVVNVTPWTVNNVRVRVPVIVVAN